MPVEREVSPSSGIVARLTLRFKQNRKQAELACGEPCTLTSQSRAPGAGAPRCFEQRSVFDGDHIGLAYGEDGRANVVWTDMRVQDTVSGFYLQFIEFPRR